ncbi:MAG: thioredoxin family protein [Flavobacteriales bacterium]
MKTDNRLSVLSNHTRSFIYTDFRSHVQALLEQGLVTGEKQGEDMVAYTTINETRMNRIEKHGVLSENLLHTIRTMGKKIQLLCITEGWCGDSAQILPYVAQMCKANEDCIDFEIILRDDNPEWMDKYLTNGSRSIPVFIAFDEVGNELFHWGPRPNTLVEEIKAWKASTEPTFTANEIKEKIHLWYARNKGADLMNEWNDLFQSVA